MTVQVPEHGGFAVYDAAGLPVAASWAWGDTSAVLPEGGWVVFSGTPGARFVLSLTADEEKCRLSRVNAQKSKNNFTRPE